MEEDEPLDDYCLFAPILKEISLFFETRSSASQGSEKALPFTSGQTRSLVLSLLCCLLSSGSFWVQEGRTS